MIWNQVVREVLKEAVEIRGGGKHGEVELEGDGHTATICDLPRGSVVIGMGFVDHPGCVRDGEYRRKCDYLVLAETDSGHCVVLVELKKTLTGERRPLQQLVRSRPIARYLVDLSAVVRGRDVEVEVFYLLVAGSRSRTLSKHRMRINPYEPDEIRVEGNARVAVFVQERVSLGAVISAGDAATG